MVLKSNFLKTAEGKIKAILEVTDSGDYPTSRIFSNTENIGSQTFTLCHSDSYFVEQIFTTAIEAKNAVRKKVLLIEEELKIWRAIEVPWGSVFEI